MFGSFLGEHYCFQSLRDVGSEDSYLFSMESKKKKETGTFQRAGIRTSLYTPCHSSMLYGKGGLLWSRTMKTVAREKSRGTRRPWKKERKKERKKKKERDRQKRRHARFLKLMCEIQTDRMVGLVLPCVDLKWQLRSRRALRLITLI